MLSSSKVKLNRSDIERIMRKVFGSKTRLVSVEENNEGWFNALYAVSLQGLPDVFLKVALPPEIPVLRYEKGLLAMEVEVPKIPSPSVFLADAEDFGVEMLFSLNRIRSFFSESADDLDFVTRPCLVHWDLRDGNILIKDKNGIAGIIDCDRALWGDPVIEYYFSIMFPSPEEFFQGIWVGCLGRRFVCLKEKPVRFISHINFRNRVPIPRHKGFGTY